MKILIIVDKKGTAIDRLAVGIQKYNPHLKIKILTFHPKRPSEKEIEDFRNEIEDTDLIDYHYYKSGLKIFELFPEAKLIPNVIVHHNPYSIADFDPMTFDKVVAVNKSIYNELLQEATNIAYIPLAVDLNDFDFNVKYNADSKKVLMVANRIEGKKGVLPIAQACKKLGYEFILVGNISDAEYFQKIINEGAIYYQNVSDQELINIYKTAAIHVCNSQDKFESGTLPILESMACGVPVLTRRIGHVPDLYNGSNMYVYDEHPEDLDAIEGHLKSIMDDSSLRESIRTNAFETVKNWNMERLARRYSNLYFKVLEAKLGQPLISVIIPTYNKPDVLVKCVSRVINNSYKNLEIVIISDGSDYHQLEIYQKVIEELSKITKFPIKFFDMPNKNGYGLAKARNQGLIEAQGEYILFLDDRIGIEPNAIEVFYKNILRYKDTPKLAFWGVKDNAEKGFVENFSFFRRKEIVEAGMFNERMIYYGGMTQELRTRLTAQGFDFKIVREAKANALEKSSSKWEKRSSIIKAKMLIFKMYNT